MHVLELCLRAAKKGKDERSSSPVNRPPQSFCFVKSPLVSLKKRRTGQRGRQVASERVHSRSLFARQEVGDGLESTVEIALIGIVRLDFGSP